MRDKLLTAVIVAGMAGMILGYVVGRKSIVETNTNLADSLRTEVSRLQCENMTLRNDLRLALAHIVDTVPATTQLPVRYDSTWEGWIMPDGETLYIHSGQ